MRFLTVYKCLAKYFVPDEQKKTRPPDAKKVQGQPESKKQYQLTCW
jgi:hypothetical protein